MTKGQTSRMSSRTILTQRMALVNREHDEGKIAFHELVDKMAYIWFLFSQTPEYFESVKTMREAFMEKEREGLWKKYGCPVCGHIPTPTEIPVSYGCSKCGRERGEPYAT